VKIVCATSVALGQEAFSSLGHVTLIPEQEITPKEVRDADLLITRSKVKIDAALLDGSRVSFVATATAGIDHLDIDYLNARSIAWAFAPGCNANSVAEWVIAALLRLHVATGAALDGKTIGIIGVGHVGSRVAALAPALGLRALLHDPPRAALEPGPMWLDRDALLAESDIVTLHVPLTDAGPYATRGMVDCRFLAAMKPGSIFINTARGEVVDEECLRLGLEQQWIDHALLDVFACEPDVDPRLASAAFLVTPHIAGYSYEGRVRGTEMCYRAACGFLEMEPRWAPPPRPTDPARTLDLDPRGRADLEALADVALRAYDIAADDRALREGLGTSEAERRRRFQQLRAHYPDRREFSAHTVRLAAAAPALELKLARLGFAVEHA
jgi:erythronate-4-phosphate dehydrogenase